MIYTTGPFADRASLQEYVSTQDFFLAAAQPGEGKLHIAHRAEPTDPDGLYLSRRAEDRNGDFVGVAFARLPLGEIRAFLERLDIGADGGISLRDLDMRIVVRHPDPRGLFRGNARLSPELTALLEAGATRATYFSGTTWDGTARTVTFSRVGKYPLYVAVGLAASDYLAEWRRGAALAAAAYAAMLALGGATLLMLRRRAALPPRTPAAPALPPALAAFFAAANAADGPKAALCFTVDGVVTDEAETHRGTADIAAWVARTQDAYRFAVTPTAVARAGGRTRVTATVAGDFPGSPLALDYLFTLKGGRIARLEIG